MNKCQRIYAHSEDSMHHIHWQCFKYLENGGKVYRDDKLNHIQEILTKEILIERHGCHCEITRYGYLTLRCVEDSFDLPPKHKVSNYIHETLLAMGFEYEPDPVDLYFYKPGEDFIEANKELDGFDTLGLNVQNLKPENIIKAAADHIWELSGSLHNEYRSEVAKEFVTKIFGFRVP